MCTWGKIKWFKLNCLYVGITFDYTNRYNLIILYKLFDYELFFWIKSLDMPKFNKKTEQIKNN